MCGPVRLRTRIHPQLFRLADRRKVGDDNCVVLLRVFSHNRPILHVYNILGQIITLCYCIKIRERSGMRSSPSGSPVSLFFWRQEWLMEDDPVQVKFERKEVDPCENSLAVHIWHHNSGTVIDSEKCSINANRKSTMGFPTSHQPRSCVTPNFFRLGFRYPNLSVFCRNFDQKPLKVCYKVSLSITSSGRVVANGINILTGDDPVPVKFGLKAPTPIGRMHVSHFICGTLCSQQ